VAGRRVFFSFHYERDIWRASNVRNAGVVDAVARAGWDDASLWEEARRNGEPEIRRLIDRGLKGTSVTVVLIGTQTATRKWVKYEIERSIERGNGLIGVRINRIRDEDGQRDQRGPVPEVLEQHHSRIYDWNRSNFGRQVERAALDAGKPCTPHGTNGCGWCKFSLWWVT